MLTINKCKEILDKYERHYTHEEIIIYRDFINQLVSIANEYLNKKKDD